MSRAHKKLEKNINLMAIWIRARLRRKFQGAAI